MTKRHPFRLLFTRSLPLAVLALLLTAHCSVLTVRGQTATATLSGTVQDEKGAVVPGVTVAVLNVDTSFRRETATNNNGSFLFTLLPPGHYSLTAEQQGFKVMQIPSVTLNVGDQKALTIQLQTGNISEMVLVTGETPLINESSAVGTVVDRRFAENIPLNGRSFQSLISLTPGVVIAPASGAANTSGQFSVNGQRTTANYFSVDGVSANFAASPGSFGGPQTTGNLPSLTTFGTTQGLVSVDALQEFKVQTSGYSAEYGRQPGGQISIVTRSGGNDFHGSLFDYFRNDVFDANDWFANANGQARPPEKQNDFGGTFSGPVLLPRYSGRNRTFFFFSYEGLRLRLPQFSLTNVPTLALRQQAPTGVQPILNAFPLPNGRDLGNGLAEFSASYSDQSGLDATSIRLDHLVGRRLTLFGRYNKAPSNSRSRNPGINLSSITLAALDTQTITIGASASIAATTANELRINYSSNGSKRVSTQDDFGGATAPPRSALIPAQYDSAASLGGVTFFFDGMTSSGSPSLTLTQNATDQRQFNVIDGLSQTWGSHQLKFGFDYRRMMPVTDLSSYVISSFFNSDAELLAASAGFATIQASLKRRPIIVNFSSYAQDVWNVSSRLQLDFGVRWDIAPAPSEAAGNDQPAVTQITNLSSMQLATLGTKAWKTSYNNFAPRVGVVYRLLDRTGRETVVRGGFGVFFDSSIDVAALNFNQGFPFRATRTVFGVNYPLSATQVAPPVLPAQTGLTPPYPTFTAFDPSLKLPYTLQWNLGVEQSLGSNQSLTLSYVAAAGKRLLQGTQLNLSSINPRFTTVRVITNKATSNYDALQVNFQRRVTRGFQSLASYTWSHALDEDSFSNSGVVAIRGNAAFDVRHLFAAAVTYDLPSPSKTKLSKALLNRWSLDMIMHVQSSFPVDISARNFVNPTDGSFNTVRPSVNTSVPLYLSDPNIAGGRRINRAAFVIPAVGQFGNLGRNVLRGFGLWQVDFAVRREFSLTEQLKLQFRAEAFNIFNHPNFGTIQTSLPAANFGQAINLANRQLGGLNQLYQIGGPRSLQFAARLVF